MNIEQHGHGSAAPTRDEERAGNAHLTRLEATSKRGVKFPRAADSTPEALHRWAERHPTAPVPALLWETFVAANREKRTAADAKIAALSARLAAVEHMAAALQSQLQALDARPVGVLDAGLHEVGKTYQRGQGVTYDGGFWTAQRETSESPGEASHHWRLAVRRGKQGREGRSCPNCSNGAAAS